MAELEKPPPYWQDFHDEEPDLSGLSPEEIALLEKAHDALWGAWL